MPDGSFVVTVKVADSGQPDGDYTAEFLEAGTTFTATEGPIVTSRPIPVERAWVEDGALYVEGHATFGSA